MSRPRTLRCQGLVLRRHDVGESDRVVVMFTRERGKLRAVAKGARKTSSRKAGHLELFTHVDVLLEQRRDMDFVGQVDTLDSFRAIREDLTRTSLAYLVTELVDSLTEEGDEQPELFDLTVQALESLQDAPDPRLVVDHFAMQLLELLGFRPAIGECLRCGSELEPGSNFFSPFLGGALCPRCGPAEPSASAIATPTLKLLRNLQRLRRPGSLRVVIPLDVQRETSRVLRELIERHSERRLRSTAFIARLRTLDETTTPS
ncbi:MAG: DNA repair protein RecO [Chloroflexota bacterium]